MLNVNQRSRSCMLSMFQTLGQSSGGHLHAPHQERAIGHTWRWHKHGKLILWVTTEKSILGWASQSYWSTSYWITIIYNYNYLYITSVRQGQAAAGVRTRV